MDECTFECLSNSAVVSEIVAGYEPRDAPNLSDDRVDVVRFEPIELKCDAGRRWLHGALTPGMELCGLIQSSDGASESITVDSSTTSSVKGHSGQLWRQQTMTSQPSTACPCSRKFRLSYSNSIRTRCHWPVPT